MFFTKEQVLSRSGKRSRQMVEFKKIYLIPQIRGEEATQLDTSDLVPSILSKGLLTPPLIAVFNKKGFSEYLDLTNRIHGSSLLLRDYPSNTDSGHWLVVIYGHRRFVACRKIYENFTAECLRDCSSDEGREFLRALSDGRMTVDLAANPLAKVAKGWQIDENYHQGVSPDKLAQVIGEMWCLEQIDNPTLTMASFSKKHSIGEGKVRDSIRYYSLPKIVKEAVARKAIEYGHGVQIARYLGEINPADPTDKANELLGHVIINRPKVASFVSWVSARIEESKSPICQLNLCDLMGAEAGSSKKMRREKTSNTVGKMLQEIMQYLTGLAFLFEYKIMLIEDSPLLSINNAKMNRDTIGNLLSLVTMFREFDLPHMTKLTEYLEELGTGERLSEIILEAASHDR